MCVQVDTDDDRGSGTDVEVCCDEAQLVTVKRETLDRSSSELCDGESREEPFAHMIIKQEVEVSQVQLKRYHDDGQVMYC